jgi:hypothetical protein
MELLPWWLTMIMVGLHITILDDLVQYMDNHSLRNCKFSLPEEVFFKQYEFITGDAAFNPSARMIRAY